MNVHAASLTCRIVVGDHEHFTRLRYGFADAKVFCFQPHHLREVASIDIRVE